MSLFRTGLYALLVSLLTLGGCENLHSIRVIRTPGGPQIARNGRLIPPRMFWGHENGAEIFAPSEWTEQAFEFTPATEISGNGTLHLRFGKSAGEIWIRDLRLFEVVSGRDVIRPDSFSTSQTFAEVWRTWPIGSLNTVGQLQAADGTLHVTVNAPPDGVWPDFHLLTPTHLRFTAGMRYRCSYRVCARPARNIRPEVYRVENGTWTRIGSPPGSLYEQVARARDAGVTLISFSTPNCWTPPEIPQDWTLLDSLCRRILAVHPKALLLPRLHVKAPDWWLQRHPDAVMMYEGNQPGTQASVSHRTYRADAAAHVERVCRHLMTTFPQNFAGIHPVGQNTGEWFYEGTHRAPLNGYDPATLAAWREWLRLRGASDYATAEVPNTISRHAAPDGVLRDPSRERRLIDFARFQQDEMADMILTLAAAARRATEGRRLVLFFYGYHYEFGGVGNGAHVSGHYALNRVLASPDIDIVCSPVSYVDRDWLGTAPAMGPVESATLAGKMWLNEDDARTYLDTRSAEHVQEGSRVNLQQSRDIMLRNTAQAAIRGMGCWWMDLYAAGWFNDPAIWEEMKRLRRLNEALLFRSRPFTPEIAAIVDENSMCHLAAGAHVMARPLVSESRAALGRSGAPYGQYRLDDVLAGRISSKLQIFIAAWALTPEQRRTLSEQRPTGITRVWCYAPGYLLPDRADVAAMKEVSGFTHRRVAFSTAVATPTLLGRAWGLTQSWGPAHPIRPLFTAEASPFEVLATYSDGSPAVAVRRNWKGIDVFVGTPQLTPELVRVLARFAGVHLYAGSDVALWASDPFISFQALREGPLTLNTGRQGEIRDALNGSLLGYGPLLRLNLRAGETRVLRY